MQTPPGWRWALRPAVAATSAGGPHGTPRTLRTARPQRPTQPATVPTEGLEWAAGGGRGGVGVGWVGKDGGKERDGEGRQSNGQTTDWRWRGPRPVRQHKRLVQPSLFTMFLREFAAPFQSNHGVNVFFAFPFSAGPRACCCDSSPFLSVCNVHTFPCGVGCACHGHCVDCGLCTCSPLFCSYVFGVFL
jgi:hypothetical protein